MTIKVFEGFAGVGSQRMALRDLGLQHEVVATSDWDYHATLSYNAIHTDNPIDYANGIDDRSIIEYLFKLKISSNGKEPMTMKQIARLSKNREVYNAFKNTNNLGSITEIETNDIPDHDLFTYSFPCQDISVAGRQKGLDEDSGTRSGLLWECRKVIVAKKPKFLLMENVKNLASKKHMPNFKKWQEWLESQGYTSYWHFMNAKEYNVPQNRDRTFMISYLGEHKPFDLPEPVELTKRLKDLLEPIVDEKYYLSAEKANQLIAHSKGADVREVGFVRKSENGTQHQSNTVYSPEHLARSMQARDFKDPMMIKVGNVNPSGRGMNGEVYDEAGLAPTLTTNKGEGPKVLQKAKEYKDPRILQVGQLFNTDSFGGNPQVGRVYDSEGISPALSTMQGGDQQPKILIKNATQQGYLEAGVGDGIDIGFSTSNTRRGKVQKEMSQTLRTSCQVGVFDGYRIRKLTPLECWRLMDFSDEDFYKAQAVCSNSQLYKQAGNSIVKAVLMAIFSQMFDVKRDKGKRTVAVRLDGDS